MKTLAALLIMAGTVAAQEQQFQAVPYGQPYQQPAQVYVPMQSYIVGPPQYQMQQQQQPQPRCWCRPRGVWGIGPFPIGYVW